jgi:hypothetical protein
MGTRRPRKGSRLYSDEPNNGEEIHRASDRFYALQTAIN